MSEATTPTDAYADSTRQALYRAEVEAENQKGHAEAWNRAYHEANTARLKAERQRDALAEALRNMLHARIVRADDVIDEARAALAQLDKP